MATALPPLNPGFNITSSTTVMCVEDPSVPESNRLVSIYDGIGTFTADIMYASQADPMQPFLTYNEIQLISYNSPVVGLSIVQTDLNTLSIQGISRNVIQGGTYKFLMPDNSVKFLPANTSEDYDALIGWEPPPIKMVQVTHFINVRIKNVGLPDTMETLILNQEIYWRYQVGLYQFQTALAKGKL